MTDCNEQKWLFQELGCRKVEVDFGGGYLSSDGGGLILRELERHSGLLGDVAGCFIDYRDQRYVEHSVRELMGITAISAPKAGVHRKPHEVCEPSLFCGSGRHTSLQRAEFSTNE